VTISFNSLQWAVLAALLLGYCSLSAICAAWTGAGWRIRQRGLQESLAANHPQLAAVVAEGYRVQLSLRIAKQLVLLLLLGLLFTWIKVVSAGGLIALLAGASLLVYIVEFLLARSLASAFAEQIFRRTMFLVRFVYLALMPLTMLPHRIHAVLTAEGSDDDQPTEAEVEAFIDVGEEEGILEEEESRLLRSIVDFGDTTVSEVMTPRTDMICTGETITIAGLRDLVTLLEPWRDGREDERLGDLLRPPLFVPETKKIDELMREFQDNRVQLAVVVDEYGGTAGLVTLEDLLEEIVGEIQDEFDEEEPLLVRQDDGSWMAGAMLDVDEFTDFFGLAAADGDYDTLGGLAIDELGHVPLAGETFEFRGLTVEIVESDERRIHRLRIAGGTVEDAR